MKKCIFILILGVFVVGFCHAVPVAYWRFEEGPTNGAVTKPFGAVDLSGNGNHLDPGTEAGSDGFRYRSSVAYTTIPGTGAANSFCIQNSGSSPSMSTRSTTKSYGVGSYPTGIDAESITPAQFTVEAFFKPESTGTYRTIVGRDAINVCSEDSKLAALYLQIQNNDNDERVKIQFTDVAGYMHVAESAPDITKGFQFSADPQGLTGKWYYVAAVSDGSTLSLYMANVSDNGPLWLLAQTDIASSGSPNTALAKGSSNGSNWHTGSWSVGRGLYDGNPADRAWGFIDEVRISDTALTPDQFLYRWQMESSTVEYSNPVRAGLIGWEAEDGSSFSGTVSVTLGADFDPALSDTGALGGAYITSETDGISSSTPGSDARTASYNIDFVEAGTYDLYARLYVAEGSADDSLFYARQFGDADPTHDGGTGYIGWCTVNGISEDYAAGKYHWINLSTYRSPYGESPSSFTVSSAGTLRWELGAREDGLRIDALAFGTSGQTFTDAQLNIAVTGVPEPPENNPIMAGADPDVLLVDNQVWLYPTSGGRQYFYAYSSNDLVTWQTHGPILNIDNASWMPDGKWAWAPGVHKKNETYYLYYSAGPKPSYIGVAASDSPGGPFVDSGAPLLADNGESGFEAIDAMVFTDPQTDISYFYAGGSAGSKLRIFELNEDMISFNHEIIVDTPPMFTEGAFMHYHNGIYYMSYSHGSYNRDSYSVHYCTAPSPTGPWTYHGPVLVSDYRHKGPGHHSFLYNAAMDQWYLFYHRWNNQTGTGGYSGGRKIAIEKMYYNPDGTIVPFPLTNKGVGPVWLGNFLRADFDESGQVGIEDIIYLSSAWLTDDYTADMTPVGVGDEIVDLADFAWFGSQWLKALPLP